MSPAVVISNQCASQAAYRAKKLQFLSDFEFEISL